MSKGCFIVGWLAGVASVVAAALVADAVQQPDVIFGEAGTAKEIEGGTRTGGEGE